MFIKVKDLRNALKGVPDNLTVVLGSNTRVDKCEGSKNIVIDGASRIIKFLDDTYTPEDGYEKEDYFAIMANYITD